MTDLAVRPERLEASVAPAPKRMTPIKWWAGLGAAFVAFELYLWSAWLLDDPQPTPPGPSTIPDWMRLSLDIWFYGGFVLAALALYFFLYKPWKRAGHLTIEGMFIIAFVTMYWQDSFGNIIQPIFTWNSRLPNWGSWDGKIPGWSFPHGERVVEPVIFAIPLYIYGLFMMVVLPYTIMRLAQKKWPHLSKLSLFGIGWAFIAAVDIPLEALWIRTGVYVFTAVPTPKWLTISDGKYYQFPLTEPFFWGITLTTMAAVWLFKDDKGNTIVERGIDRIRATTKQKILLRLFAIIGMVNLSCLVLYMIPFAVQGYYIRPFPKDIVTRSYFTNSLCGPGTTVACPGGEIFPVPRGRSNRFGPDGQIFRPDGKEFPNQLNDKPR